MGRSGARTHTESVHFAIQMINLYWSPFQHSPRYPLHHGRFDRLLASRRRHGRRGPHWRTDRPLARPGCCSAATRCAWARTGGVVRRRIHRRACHRTSAVGARERPTARREPQHRGRRLRPAAGPGTGGGRRQRGFSCAHRRQRGIGNAGTGHHAAGAAGGCHRADPRHVPEPAGSPGVRARAPCPNPGWMLPCRARDAPHAVAVRAGSALWDPPATRAAGRLASPGGDLGHPGTARPDRHHAGRHAYPGPGGPHLLQPGDAVLVDEPGWAVEFARLTRLGMRLLPVPRGRRARPQVLAGLLQAHRPRLYVTVGAAQPDRPSACRWLVPTTRSCNWPRPMT